MVLIELKKPIAGFKTGHYLHATFEELTALGLRRQDYTVLGSCINQEQSDLTELVKAAVQGRAGK